MTLQMRCQFGDVLFDFQVNGRETQIADWEQDANYAIHIVPGSNPPIVEVDRMSFGPAQATWTIVVDSHDDHQAMWAKLGTADALVVPTSLQRFRGTRLSGQYGTFERLSPVTLLSLSAPQSDVDPLGPVEMIASFLYVVDPRTGLVAS